MSKLLIVEDDPNLRHSIPTYLKGEGYEVALGGSLKEARVLFASGCDLIVLDWMLPDGQGLDFLREIRQRGSTVPIIFLTARSDLIDKVVGLETGANDYLTKPFEPRELVARIRAHLRAAAKSSSGSLASILRVGAIEIDPATRLVRHHGTQIELTKMEFDLLRLLCENPNRVFTRDELLNQVWGFNQFPTTRTVDTHILQLRQKLGEDLFETVRGVGYRLKI